MLPEISLAMRNLDLNTYDDWIQSQNGSEFCHFDDVPQAVRSQLRQEDKYTTTIHGFRYTVKEYDGKWLVFRRNISMNTVKTTQTQHYMVHCNYSLLHNYSL